MAVMSQDALLYILLEHISLLPSILSRLASISRVLAEPADEPFQEAVVSLPFVSACCGRFAHSHAGTSSRLSTCIFPPSVATIGVGDVSSSSLELSVETGCRL